MSQDHNQNLPTVSQYVLEEQEWIPGLKAPFLFWITMAGAAGYLLLSSVWLYHHNKKRIAEEYEEYDEEEGE